MKIITGPRGTGKTTKLLKEISMEYDNPTVVCRDPRHMIEKAFIMGIKNIKFITIDDLLSCGTEAYTDLFFDDIDDFLVDLFGADNVKGYTIII